jgi:hypothetical protein
MRACHDIPDLWHRLQARGFDEQVSVSRKCRHRHVSIAGVKVYRLSSDQDDGLTMVGECLQGIEKHLASDDVEWVGHFTSSG